MKRLTRAVSGASLAAFFLTLAFATEALAHAIGGRNAAFVAAVDGPDPVPFVYLGAKHMVTGYDHLLFLIGVIFFLYRFRDIAIYVTMFSIGHSITLLAGVYFAMNVDSYLVDAVIGFSVIYKAFDNLGGMKTVFGFQPDNRPVVLGFGLIHGFGLATKLQALSPSPNGLLVNLISFNVGVELGQIIALSLILLAMTLWRKTPLFEKTSTAANVLIMVAGSVFMVHQIAGFFLQGDI
jgi:hypothetical protein